MQPQMDAFRAAFGSRGTVLSDQFNFIVLFAHHHDWEWRLVWQDRRRPMWQLWQVSRAEQRFNVCRSGQWLLDLASPDSYQEVSACLARAGANEVVVFRPEQPDIAPTGKGAEAPELARRLSGQIGLTPVQFEVQGNDFYASFTSSADVAAAEGGLRMEVTEATYGGNCSGEARGNATALVREACSGRARCSYRVDTDVLGDPKRGCAKDFQVDWSCSPGATGGHAQLAAEAGFGSTVVLECR
jgi:hypothetical protein